MAEKQPTDCLRRQVRKTLTVATCYLLRRSPELDTRLPVGRDDVGIKTIVVDHYAGAYGPTLRIDVQSVEALDAVREVFANLAEWRKQEIPLSEIPNVRLSPHLSSVVLRVSDAGASADKRLEVTAQGAQGVSVLWYGPPEYWRRCVGLTDGLLKNVAKSGHQYLTIEGVDDALVELSFRE